MDMQAKKIVIVAALFVFNVVGGWSLLGGIPSAVAVVAPPQAEAPAVAPATTLESAPHHSKTFAEIEAGREQELEDKRNADELAKQKLKKGKSVECQFWKQQQKMSSAPSVHEKVEKFCNI